MTIYITLTQSGLDVGPFNIYSNVDNYVSAIAVNISRSTLISGYATSVPNGTSVVRIISNGNCTNFIDVNVN
jgi:hypothetical protein